MLHDRGRAEEVTQDGFLRLYQRWPQAVSYDHPVAWVRKVVVRDAIRRAERERRQQPDARPRRPRRRPTGCPTSTCSRRSAELPPRQRAAVALFYLEDRPVDEIADLMQVTASTVKQHLYQARKRLSEVLVEGVVGDVG